MTLATLTTEIRVALGNQDSTAIPDSRIWSAINGAIDYLEHNNFWFQYGEASLTLTVDQPNISINAGFPTDFGSELPRGGLSIVYSDSFYPLEKIGVEEYDLRDEQSSDLPRWYTVKDGTIHLLPYPDQAYTLKFRYRRTYTPLTDGGQTNGFLDNAERVVKFVALADLFMDERKDEDRYDKNMSRADAEVFRLKRVTNQKRGAGRLVPDGVMVHNYYNVNIS